MGLADRIKRTADRLSHTSVRGSGEARIVGGKVVGGAKAVYGGGKKAYGGAVKVKNKIDDFEDKVQEKKEARKLAKEIKQLDDFQTEHERDQRAADYVYGRKLTPGERKAFAKYKKEHAPAPRRDIFTGRDPPRHAVGRKVRSVEREAVRDAKRYDVNDAVRSSPFGGPAGGNGLSSKPQKKRPVNFRF